MKLIRRQGRILLFLGAAAAVSLAARFGTSCSVGILAGVHFRNNPVDFGAPPPRYSAEGFFDWARPNDYRAGTRLLENFMNSDSDDRAQKLKASLDTAQKEEEAGDFASAIAIYRNLNQHGAGLAAAFQRRIALLEQAQKNGASPDLKRFLAATALDGSSGELPSEDKVSPLLKPYVVYESASRLYGAGDYDKASKGYHDCVQRYPGSDLAEPAAIMAVRSALMVTNKPASNDPQALNQAIGEAARGQFKAFIEKYPHSRFRKSALGSLARCDYLTGHSADAEKRYRELLGQASSTEEKDSVLQSLIRCYQDDGEFDLAAETWLRDFAIWKEPNHAYIAARYFQSAMSHVNGEQSGTFRASLVVDPDLAASYLTIRLDLMNTNKDDRAALTSLAGDVVQRNPRAGAVLVRLAQMAYTGADYDKAHSFAQRALDASKDDGDNWALAEYIVGSASMRKGEYQNAESAYLAVSKANSFLADGASEALIYLYDRAGDLDSALQTCYVLMAKAKAAQNDSANPDYYQLQGDYSEDAAYLLDVKMTPAEIAAMSRRHSDSAHKNEWTYALGFRYLRKEMFADAKKEFEKIPDDTRRSLAGIWKDNNHDDGPIQDPLQTTKDLAQLTFDSLRGSDEQRAAALYRKASYYYARRGLLFYDYSAWQYARVMAIDDAWNDSVASPRDVAALKDHEYEHECLVHAADICHEIVEKYPKSASAPAAIYRQACALERLGNENRWWRWQGGLTKTAQQASDLMAELPKKYPNSPLAKNAAKYSEAFGKEANDVHNSEVLNKWPSEYKVGWYGH